MDEQYKRAKELFLTVCDLDPDKREALLEKGCGDDVALRKDVESLLAHYDGADETVAIPTGPASTIVSGNGNGQPDHIGPYRIIYELGRGGMGVIYLGQDDRFKRRAAIKVVKRGMDTVEVLGRFDQERHLLAALNHSGIAKLYQAGETEDGLPYFAMEYVDGLPIDEYCDKHRLTVVERLELFQKVCSSVHYAHQNLVVHRDLKPSNLLVTEEGVPKLLDFGIAKLLNPQLLAVGSDPTRPESRVMTPEYASPEQVRGDPITTASDVYSLGVLLYELVSGHRPYRLGGRGRAEIEHLICDEDPQKPSTAVSRVDELEPEELASFGSTTTITPESVSRVREGRPERLRRKLAGDIDNIVLKAMRKEPQRRYGSAEQLAEDIRRHLDGLPVTARRDTFTYRSTKFVRRHRAAMAAAAVIAISLFGGTALASWGWQEADAGRGRAERMFNQVRELARIFMFDFHDAIQKLDGSIPARELLVTTALEYLDGLAQEADDDTELKRELASAYDRVGDIRGGIRNPSLGDTEGALENYRTALEFREALVAASPNDTKLQKEVSTSHIKVGDMLTNSGDIGGALAAYRKALAIREALVEDDPKSVKGRRDLFIALNNVGAALIRTGELTAAIDHYDRSLDLRKEVAAAERDEPLYKRDLSSGHIRMGIVLEVIGDHEAALELYQQAVAIRKQLLKGEPDTSRAKRDLAVAHYYMGNAHLAVSEPGSAMEHLNYFLDVAEQQNADNPFSARAKRDLARAYEVVGEANAMMGDWDRALQSYRRFQSIILPLADSDPSNTQYRALVARSYERLGELAAASGEVEDAIDSYRQALEIIEALANADPDDTRRTADRARLLAGLGGVLAEAAELSEAQRRLESARALYESLWAAQPENAALRDGLANTLHEFSKLMATLDDGEAALQYAQEALATVNESSPSMLRALAVALDLTGDATGAIQAVEEALQLLDQGEVGSEAEHLRQTLEADLGRYRQGDQRGADGVDAVHRAPPDGGDAPVHVPGAGPDERAGHRHAERHLLARQHSWRRRVRR
ncbi:MAG: protein kinase [Planctomycetes bacterium]|nr:protein kinase [Planctomycetota bacterium]